MNLTALRFNFSLIVSVETFLIEGVDIETSWTIA